MDASVCPASRGLGVLAWVTFVLTWIVQGMRAAPSTKSAGTLLKDRLTAGTVYLCAFALVASLFTADHSRMEWICVVGGAVTVSGVALAVWARLNMGALWSSSITLKDDHKLIRSGPFALVRHPIYAGLVFATVGGIMQSQTLLGTVAGLVVVSLILLKLRREEGFLLAEFGDAYKRYAAETAGMLPFVW